MRWEYPVVFASWRPADIQQKTLDGLLNPWFTKPMAARRNLNRDKRNLVWTFDLNGTTVKVHQTGRGARHTVTDTTGAPVDTATHTLALATLGF